MRFILHRRVVICPVSIPRDDPPFRAGVPPALAPGALLGYPAVIKSCAKGTKVTMLGYPKTNRQAALIELADRLAGPIAARAARYDRSGEFPFENVEEMRQAGYLAITVPEEYGGFGADAWETALAQERIARACGSTALLTTMHLALIGRLGAGKAWPEPVYAAVCREVVANGALINTINSEPTMGSPSRGGMPSTSLVRQPDGSWLLSGHKSWGSLAPGLTFMSIMCAVIDGDEPPRRANVLVRADQPGIRIVETWDTLGMRATASHDVVLENVCLPADTPILADASQDALRTGGWSLFPSMTVWYGIAAAARDAAIAYACERTPTGMTAPIAGLQTIQHRVAEMELLLWQAGTVLSATAERWLAAPLEERAGMDWEMAGTKRTVANNAIEVTDLAMRVVGAASMSRDMPLERYYRDVRAGLGQPPMEDVALTIVGKAALGLSGGNQQR
jgi:alkylation response protein AidB-like acyl-CoA dehydrogenase